MPKLIKVYDFKGTGSLTNSLSSSYTLNFTIELWVKPHSTTQKDFTSFLMRGNSSSANGIHIHTGKIAYRSGEVSGQGTTLDDFTQSNYPVGQWTHIALVVNNGKNFNYYRNFTKVNSGILANDSNSTSSVISIGDWSANYGSQFNGSLALVRLWNKDLATTSIQENSKTVISTSTPNLVYQLDAEKGVDITYGNISSIYDFYVKEDNKLILKNNENVYSLDNKTLIHLPNTSDKNMILFGLEAGKEIKLDEDFDKMKYVQSESEVLGEGKVYKHEIDISKTKINKLNL